jgi:CheY-like chemotaxis protein
VSELPRVLVVEDGHEYIQTLSKYLGSEFEFSRAGNGFEAIELLSAELWHGVFMDMRFDRADRLMGDMAALTSRFHGDSERARRYLENQQGTYIAAAIRTAGFGQPLLFSYDFSGEPTRLAHLQQQYGPLAYLPDTAGPAEVREGLWGLWETGD